MPSTTFDGAVNSSRAGIKKDAAYLLELVKSVKGWTPEFDNGGKADKSEIIANLMLSYRHMEDASMRLGKVLQAWDGGVSVYDKNTTVGVE